MPCAKIATLEERAEHAHYWRERLRKMELFAEKHDLRDLSDKGISDYRSMPDFANKTANILELVQDVLRPRTFDKFVKYGFDDPPAR